MGVKSIITLCVSIYYAFNVSGQENTQVIKNDNRGNCRIMFYNTENFFDTRHDTLKNDFEYLPESPRHWTIKKYKQKLDNIYKVIVAVGEWEPPEIVGLCEIENRHVLNDLVYNTPLSKYNYGIVHRESPDERGIDVALIYRKNKFKVIGKHFIGIAFPSNAYKKTRDILYAKGVLDKSDTVHLLVNHFPSRSGGEFKSGPYRIYVASILRKTVDSIFTTNKTAKIIIMGDFNDEPGDKSIIEILNAKIPGILFTENNIYNLAYPLKKKGPGTLKYRETWSLFDQIMVSGTLLANRESLHTMVSDFHIFDAAFLLQEDNKYFGLKPIRTYERFTYKGGFSDHLPVYLDLRKNEIKSP
jgi:predicted extracellular nuclease